MCAAATNALSLSLSLSVGERRAWQLPCREERLWDPHVVADLSEEERECTLINHSFTFFAPSYSQHTFPRVLINVRLLPPTNLSLAAAMDGTCNYAMLQCCAIRTSRAALPCPAMAPTRSLPCTCSTSATATSR